jgi:hypothetical protein
MSINDNIGKYVPLKTVVSYFLDEAQKSQGDEDECWILALRGLTLMGQQFAAEPKTVRLPKNGNQTVTIPPDCISWTKIGLLDEKGQINTLKINTAITTYADTSPNRIERLTPNINDGLAVEQNLLYQNFYNQGVCYNLFGVGGGLIQYGECRVDETNNLIVLSPEFKYDNIILEYISNPKRDEDYMVLTSMQEAIIAFISWKKKTGTRQDFYAAATEARRTLTGKKVTLQTINDVIRQTDSMKLRS